MNRNGVVRPWRRWGPGSHSQYLESSSCIHLLLTDRNWLFGSCCEILTLSSIKALGMALASSFIQVSDILIGTGISSCWALTLCVINTWITGVRALSQNLKVDSFCINLWFSMCPTSNLIIYHHHVLWMDFSSITGLFFFWLFFCLEQQYADLEKRCTESQDQCLSITKDHQKLQEEFTSLGKHF